MAMRQRLTACVLAMVTALVATTLGGCASNTQDTPTTTSEEPVESTAASTTSTTTPGPHTCAKIGCGKNDGTCYCNAECERFNDCCSDYAATCSKPKPDTTTPPPNSSSCLCVFDIDRTLTAKQGQEECPGTKVVPNVEDKAYLGGTLILSDLALHLEETFCAKCHMSVVSAGLASGDNSKMRAKLLELLGKDRTLTDHWSSPGSVESSLVVGAPDTHKQEFVRKVVQWFASEKHVSIADKDVHFFDDRPINVNPFEGTGFDAREISCTSRDDNGALGLCGGLHTEVSKNAGVKSCTPGREVAVLV